MAPKKQKNEEEAVVETNTESTISEAEMAELKANSDKVEAQRKEMEAKAQVARLESEKEASKGTYTKEEVNALVKQALKEFAQNPDKALDDMADDDPYKVKKLSIPRFPNKDKEWKFVVAFANVNNDEYFKDKVIQAFDIWDDMTKKNVPYVKLVFEDETEMTVPLFTAIKKSQKVACEIVDVPKVDKSYSAGRTEVATVDGYSRKVTGTVPMRVVKYDYSFIVRLPNGRELPVSKDVVNWQIIPN